MVIRTIWQKYLMDREELLMRLTFAVAGALIFIGGWLWYQQILHLILLI